MAKLDIAEKRLPQDGRIKIRYNESGEPKEIDFRVSVLPTLFGEKIVLRLLDKDKLMLDMTRLGFEPESLSKYEAAILRPWGMVLVTGPTGSGKTNTLYSSISKINTSETNIMTARGAWYLSPARPDPGRPTRSIRRSRASTRPRRTS
jgi:type IV pilus assembly protein PilB